jgi:hypothetical protein
MTATVASYGLAGAGLALLVVTAFLLHFRKVAVPMANGVMLKMVRAGNLDRLQKLCAAAPGTYLDAIGAAVAALPSSKDRITIAACIDGAFDPIARKLEKRWAAQSERGLLGCVLVAGGLALQLSGDTGAAQPMWVAAGIAAVGAMWILSLRRHVVLAVSAARREVLPELVEAAVSR